MNALGAAYDRFIAALAALSALSIAAMALWVTYEVIVRYLFVSPTSWAVDLAEYALIWSTFLAAPWVLQRSGHVSIDLLTSHLSPRARRSLEIATALAGAVVCALFAWYSAATVIEFFVRGSTIDRLWPVPRYLPFVPIPLGTLLLAIEFLRRAFRTLRLDRPDPAAVTARDTGLG